MAKRVDAIFVNNWQNTGQKVQVDKWTADVTVQWTDDSDTPHEWTGVVTFPNDLATAPANWLKNSLMDLVIRAARKRLGIDAEDTP